MAGSDLGFSLFFGLLVLLFYYVRARADHKKRPIPPVERERTVSTVKKPPPVQKELRKIVPDVYKPPKRKKDSVLKKGWNSKSSIRQAFILSEVFRRYDEP